MLSFQHIRLLAPLLVVLIGSGCRSPNDQASYNPYTRSAGRPWLKRAESLIDAAETQVERLDSRMENILY